MSRQWVKAERYPLFDKLILAIFILLVPVAVGSANKVFGDGDVSWHIAAGRWILDHREVPATDPFSFTKSGEPWVAFEWLSQILYASAFNLWSYAGVAAVVTLAIMALHAVVFAFLRGRVRPVSLLLAIVTMDAVLITFMVARPHLLVWPVLAFWTAMMIRSRDKGRAPPLALALLMLVWANSHGSFMLGFVVAGAMALDALIAAQWNRRLFLGWLNFGLAALIAALLNANGIAGFLHPVAVMGLENLAFIEEWQPSNPSVTPLFYALLIGTIGALLLKGVRLSVGETILLLFLLVLAFMQVRHQSWLAIVAPLILAPRMVRRRESVAPFFKSPAERRAWLIGMPVAAVLLLAGRLAIPLEPRDEFPNPRGLIANIPGELRSKPVFNEYSFGGPLILAGIRPYIDGRSDMYGDAFMEDYMKIAQGDRARFDRTIRKYGIAWTVLPPNSLLAKELDASPKWQRVYSDRVGVIHVRRATR